MPDMNDPEDIDELTARPEKPGLSEESDLSDLSDLSDSSDRPDADSDAAPRGSRSAWSVWLHPAATARELQSLEEENATLAELLARTERERARLFDESSRLADELRTVEERELRETTYAAARIDELTRDIDAMERELEEWRQTRIELDKIQEQLKEWEDIKAAYQKKIKMLTLRLRDALGHKKFGAAGGADNYSDILEDGESPFIERGEHSEEAAAQKAAIEEMLTSALSADPPPLDMTRKDNPSVEEDVAEQARRRLPKDDTDWLISLPDI